MLYIELCSWICYSGLAEAGVIPSKLSPNNSSDNGSEGQGDMNFFPERYDMCTTFSNNFQISFSLDKTYLVSRFLSRQDLTVWKARLEYEFVPGIVEQVKIIFKYNLI